MLRTLFLLPLCPVQRLAEECGRPRAMLSLPLTAPLLLGRLSSYVADLVGNALGCDDAWVRSLGSAVEECPGRRCHVLLGPRSDPGDASKGVIKHRSGGVYGGDS